MAAREIRMKTSTIAIILIIIAILGAIAYTYLYVPPAVVPPKYTKSLVAGIRASDLSTGSAITSNIALKLYASGTDPFTRVFIEKYIRTATYSATTATLGAAWTFAGVDSGSYLLLAEDTATTKTKYPEKLSVTLPGTDKPEKEEWLVPGEVAMVQRATTIITTSGLAYNTTSLAYDITATKMNTTLYDKWLFTFTFTISGTDKVVKAGRIYFTKVSGLVPTEYSLDGAVKVAMLEDTDASDDGLTGYYVEFTSDWEGGEIHRLDVYFDDYGATGISGTETIKCYEYYACHNTNLRWWTDKTTTVTVEA